MTNKIQNLQDAQQAWQRFYQRQHHPIVDRSRYQQTLAPEQHDVQMEKYTKQAAYLRAAIGLQKKWQDIRHSDAKVAVNLKGNHHGELLHLVNKNKIKKSLHKEKLETLANAVRKGRWDDAIFEDETLPELAMSLFASEKITQQQIYTILDRHQTFQDYPLIANYRILDDDGQFTSEAEKYFFPIIHNSQFFLPLSTEQKEIFRLLLLSLPASERVFSAIQSRREHPDNNNDVENELVGMGIYESEAQDMLLHLSFGTRDALGLIRFGEENYVHAMPRLGMQTKNDIEEGIRQHSARYAVLNYPETKSYDAIHGVENLTAFQASAHDNFHSLSASMVPNDIQQAVLHIIDLVRIKTPFKWSREVWSWLDDRVADYILYKYKGLPQGGLSSQEKTDIFYNAIIDHESICSYSGELKPLGAILLLDLVKNKDEWLEKYNIDIAYLSHPKIKPIIEEIMRIAPFIKDNDETIQVAKCLLHARYLVEKGSFKSRFERVGKDFVIEFQAAEIDLLEDLRFVKVKESDCDNILRIDKKYSNTIFLMHQGMPLSIKNSPKHTFMSEQVANSNHYSAQ